MLHDPVRRHTHQALTHAIAADAAARDADGGFPRRGFEALERYGHIARPPRGPGRSLELLCLLSAVGRGDLNVGRIFEGHVNALTLVDQCGSASQKTALLGEAAKGAIFGVWNTDRPGDPLRLDGDRLHGAKSFASGVDGLTAAIVTVDTADGRQMLVVPTAGLVVDRTWWNPSGMRASGSHVVSANGLAVTEEMMLGKPGDYIAEPWFSGGAIRFLAVQTGGLHAVFDCALDHLEATGRGASPYQAHRLGLMAAAVQTSYGWLTAGAEAWEQAMRGIGDRAAAQRFIATVQGARAVVERAALDVLELAERAVGAAGFNAPHPLERLDRDLRTYLRQPNPDGALAAFGEAVLEGAWRPGFPPHAPHADRSAARC